MPKRSRSHITSERNQQLDRREKYFEQRKMVVREYRKEPCVVHEYSPQGYVHSPIYNEIVNGKKHFAGLGEADEKPVITESQTSLDQYSELTWKYPTFKVVMKKGYMQRWEVVILGDSQLATTHFRLFTGIYPVRPCEGCGCEPMDAESIEYLYDRSHNRRHEFCEDCLSLEGLRWNDPDEYRDWAPYKYCRKHDLSYVRISEAMQKKMFMDTWSISSY